MDTIQHWGAGGIMWQNTPFFEKYNYTYHTVTGEVFWMKFIYFENKKSRPEPSNFFHTESLQCVKSSLTRELDENAHCIGSQDDLCSIL